MRGADPFASYGKPAVSGALTRVRGYFDPDLHSGSLPVQRDPSSPWCLHQAATRGLAGSRPISRGCSAPFATIQKARKPLCPVRSEGRYPWFLGRTSPSWATEERPGPLSIRGSNLDERGPGVAGISEPGAVIRSPVFDHTVEDAGQLVALVVLSSSPGESHPQALTEPYVNLSIHTALLP